MSEEIRKILAPAIRKIAPAWRGEIIIEFPHEVGHGDASSPVALQIAKILRLPPREVAQLIVDSIASERGRLQVVRNQHNLDGATQAPIIEKIEIAGPGFINFFLTPAFLTQFVQQALAEGPQFGSCKKYAGSTVVTDTSHPNIAKPMGVHHLLSTIIGNSINRLLAAVGYTVIRDNYLGDWGTQYGKLMYAYKKWGDKKTVEANPIPELLKLYVRFHEEAEKDAALEEEGRRELKKLEEGDSARRALWQWIVDVSIQEFKKLWDRLEVSFDVIHGESFYEDKMEEIINMGISKGIFVEGERGALIAPFDHDRYPPCIIRKSDGATLYATRDLARTKYWEDTWHPRLMIIVADTAQQMHFQQFFEVAAKLGITEAKNIHVWFGRMSFPEKRMSTRKGNIILMEELLDEAEAAAYKIVQQKKPELAETEKKEVARKVGIGAVKYAVLAQNRTTNITFTWDKMLSLDGNSAPYLQYVHARACSILRKKTARGAKKKGGKYILKELQELALARLLPRMRDVVVGAAEEFKPNLLANYLYEVAAQFNAFYAAVPVWQAPEEAQEGRLALVQATIVVLRNGLSLLGIAAPEEM